MLCVMKGTYNAAKEDKLEKYLINKELETRRKENSGKKEDKPNKKRNRHNSWPFSCERGKQKNSCPGDVPGMHSQCEAPVNASSGIVSLAANILHMDYETFIKQENSFLIFRESCIFSLLLL